VLIGGMLRDLYLFGNLGFTSDLDFVINPDVPKLFDEKMKAMGAMPNRFGGYSLQSRKWKIDIWSLPATWAHTAGHVKIKDFEDLTHTTFFSSDAIVYNLSTKRITTAGGYFDRIDLRLLEVNLLPNPNPNGNAVRAFRYAKMKGFRWGPQLTEFVADIIAQIGWDKLEELEFASFNTSCIAGINRAAFESAIRLYLSRKADEAFTAKPYLESEQLKLPFNTYLT
jgi:hypothetical protein